MYSKPSWCVALLLGLGISAEYTVVQAAELGAKAEPIKLAMNEWTGQHITTHIAGQLLGKLGYEAEYVPAGYLAQHTALTQGTLHASLEIWSDRVSDVYLQGLEQGKLTKLGELGMEARQGWLYPNYMEEICPGLPKWEALKDCKDALVTAESFYTDLSSIKVRRTREYKLAFNELSIRAGSCYMLCVNQGYEDKVGWLRCAKGLIKQAGFHWPERTPQMLTPALPTD